jgi:sugar phosphate isomerase/epimerase
MWDVPNQWRCCNILPAMISRRRFGCLAAGAALTSRLLPAAPNSMFHGVQIGAQSYSYRDRDLDQAIAGMVTNGLNECELWQGHVEPKTDQRKWRETVSLDKFKEVRKKFDDAGIRLYAYNYSFRDDFNDTEIARGFEMAEALGVGIITASSNVTTARKVDPFAQKARIRVGFHNHSNMHDNEFNTPESFAKALAGGSKYLAINLDIGHFTAAGFDAPDYLAKHHDRVVTLHIKDRKKNQGDNMPFGQGDTPIKAVLQLLKKHKWKIPANIEYEYKGGDTIDEMNKCVAYCKAQLA